MLQEGSSRTPYEYLNRCIGDMLRERSSWDAHWKELFRNFSPRKGKFYTSDRNRGNMRNELYNNTPLFAKRVMRAGLMTGMTSPARPWFRLGPPDPEMENYGPVRGWLDTFERLLYRVFSSSNLYQQLPHVYDECGVIGTAALLQDEHFENISHFTTFTAGEYMIDMNGDLIVDTFAREFEMTVYQVVSRFGMDNLSPTVKRAWEHGNYQQAVQLRHIIEPVSRFDLDAWEQFRLPEQFGWRSVIYEYGHEELRTKFLSVKGYNEFPLMCPRWDPKAGDTYGYSAAMDALGDARALQIQEKEKGKAIAKMVAPPTKAPSSLRDANVSLLPGANTFVDDPNNVFSPIYQVQPRVGELMNDIMRTEDRINRAFYVDLFLMISRQDDVRTATEIASREEEKLLQLGPVLEALHNELLDPLIDRTTAIIMRESRRGWQGTGPMLLPPPPPELEDQELKVDYISTLAQAQKLVSTGAMERWVGFTGQLAQLKPSALRRINEDGITKQMAEDLGVPNAAMHDDDTVRNMAEAEMQAAQMEAAQQQTDSALGAATALADIDTTGANALTDLVGSV